MNKTVAPLAGARIERTLTLFCTRRGVVTPPCDGMGNTTEPLNYK